MISNEELEQRLRDSGDVIFVKMQGDGYHYQLVVVSDVFVGKSRVARQQWVYAKLHDYIANGSVHALSMRTLTRDEWEKEHG
ncbi:BolA like protein [Legionella geestiana]|uniref:BolA like protein n=1 Tax=Legionella geestiana TaxID=45065 RepID=A0A0W0TS99_9GAMM|nr:BolA/IbaG family iron-sulfur metabolism protein [Legionella geestiana]KTC98334.1 BolA like protein [Legionella geestiana]QBS11380.1 BolA/IbaG family iron-sulfur metabolism protein [Legionella geestiana]QDQ38932.1 BolA/IbaG family iron-sulfur metabolism protein [Legionella geestiana]STX53965.1 BolA like protein [Legionella geestiana]